MPSDLCTQRRALKRVGAVAAVSLAGCLSDEDENGNGGSVGDTDDDDITLSWADHFLSGEFFSLDVTSRYVMERVRT